MNKLDDIELDTFLLIPAEDRNIDSILDLLKYMEGMQLDLQRKDVTLSNVCDNCSKVIKAFPGTQERLKPDAKIVDYSLLEDTIVQIQSCRERQISSEQRKLISKFQKSPCSDLTESSALFLLWRA